MLKTIAAAGIPPSTIEIEITETVAMLDPRTTAREIAPLRAAGVRLAIDDFGTGYSNLASLTRMPFDILKIDRSFVSECVRDGSARVVVATILTMTQNLGFETVAEGVESAAQREFLLAQGCTFAQGLSVRKADAGGGIRNAVLRQAPLRRPRSHRPGAAQGRKPRRGLSLASNSESRWL